MPAEREHHSLILGRPRPVLRYPHVPECFFSPAVDLCFFVLHILSSVDHYLLDDFPAEPVPIFRDAAAPDQHPFFEFTP